MSTTYELSSIVLVVGSLRLFELDYFGGYEVDFDLAAIEADYRAAINAALPNGVTLAGDRFFATVGEYAPDNEELGDIIGGIDFDQIVQKHDRTA